MKYLRNAKEIKENHQINSSFLDPVCLALKVLRDSLSFILDYKNKEIHAKFYIFFI